MDQRQFLYAKLCFEYNFHSVVLAYLGISFFPGPGVPFSLCPSKRTFSRSEVDLAWILSNLLRPNFARFSTACCSQVARAFLFRAILKLISSAICISSMVFCEMRPKKQLQRRRLRHSYLGHLHRSYHFRLCQRQVRTVFSFWVLPFWFSVFQAP